MEIEQRFLESDLMEIEKIIMKTIESKVNIAGIWRKQWVSVFLFVLAGILFVCSGALYFLEGKFSNRIMLYVILAVISLCWPFVLGTLKRKKSTLPTMLVRKRYEEPFNVVFREKTLLYRNQEFAFRTFSEAIGYKNFLFLYTHQDKKWLILKAGQEEKNLILKMMQNVADIHLKLKEEPFSLREY